MILEILRFVFTDFWHFAGFLILLVVIISPLYRRPNVTNVYELPIQDDDEDKAKKEADAEKKARSDMWKRDA